MVKLTLLDRLIIPSILKQEGKFEEMIINKDIKSKIEITQDEVKEYSIQTLKSGGISYNQKGIDAEFEFEFTELETNTIKEGLKKLHNEEKLTEDHIDLYKIFVK